MGKEYYVIMREHYGFPEYLDTDLSDEEDCFDFDTEYEANQCLKQIFNNGEWMKDERYGKVRYYVERRVER